MLVAAITLHNLPEGLAVGVSFAGGDSNAGISTTLGIGIQNMPERLAVAGLLASIGWSRGISVLIALASGLVEPVAGLLGAAASAVPPDRLRDSGDGLSIGTGSIRFGRPGTASLPLPDKVA